MTTAVQDRGLRRAAAKHGERSGPGNLRSSLAEHFRGATHSRQEAAAAILRLAALTAAGVATGDALASSARSGRPLLLRLHASVRRGASLSAAMGAKGMPFDEAEIAVIRAGERGGSTPRALALLGQRMEAGRSGRRRIAAALAYPCILASGAVAALCFLSIVVLPSFTTLYTGSHVELPWTTRTLLAFGDGARSWGPAVAAGSLAAFALTAAARRRSAVFAMFWDRTAFEVTPFRVLVAPRAIHEAASLLALLFEVGCEADESLALAMRAASNRSVAAKLRETLRSLRHGLALSRAWSAAGLDASGDALALLEIAEVTGGYAEAFARLAALEGSAAEQALTQACRLAEPAAVVAMAVAVGGGVLAVYQPMLGSASLLLGGTS